MLLASIKILCDVVLDLDAEFVDSIYVSKFDSSVWTVLPPLVDRSFIDAYFLTFFFLIECLASMPSLSYWLVQHAFPILCLLNLIAKIYLYMRIL